MSSDNTAQATTDTGASETTGAGHRALGAERSPEALGVERSERTKFRFGARPTIGTSAALKAVAQDTTDLVRAEIELAKAEMSAGIKANATGIGLLIGAGVMIWLAVQGLLIAAGLALALVLPGWASALIISVVLIVVAGIAGLIARRMLGTPIGVDQAKTNVQEDVAWFKTHLPRR